MHKRFLVAAERAFNEGGEFLYEASKDADVFYDIMAYKDWFREAYGVPSISEIESEQLSFFILILGHANIMGD